LAEEITFLQKCLHQKNAFQNWNFEGPVKIFDRNILTYWQSIKKDTDKLFWQSDSSSKYILMKILTKETILYSIFCGKFPSKCVVCCLVENKRITWRRILTKSVLILTDLHQDFCHNRDDEVSKFSVNYTNIFCYSNIIFVFSFWQIYRSGYVNIAMHELRSESSQLLLSLQLLKNEIKYKFYPWE